ncbi:MAG: hypothetical protein HFJ43_01865 [Clostridia bacterium]|nr:hypothetical protein [Clostridia bacterium]
MSIVTILQIILAILVFIIFCLIGIYVLIMYVNKKKEEEPEEEEEIVDESLGTFRGLSKESIYKFMEFDEIKDNMIVRKNRNQYVMVIQCQGVNYDLMSDDEKMAVEEGFVQFLNTLRFPIQLYVQTRSLNLKDIIDEYKEKVSEIAIDIEKLNSRIANAKTKGNEKLKQKLEFEKLRKTRVLEYGIDISDYVGRMSLNKNILQQKTYVVISYYSNEFSGAADSTPDELDNIAFSELYTRVQSIIHALQASGVNAKILDSENLAELLYVAYNRDDSELIQLSKALDSQYDALYSSGKDVLEKKQEKLEAAINSAAIELATDSIIKADKYRQIDKLRKSQLIKEKANDIIDEYKEQMDPVIYEGARKEIEKAEIEDTDNSSEELKSN